MAPSRFVTLLVAVAALAAGCTGGGDAPATGPEEDAPPFTPPSLRDYPPSAPRECPPHTAQGLELAFNVTEHWAERGGAENAVLVDEGAAPAEPVVTWVWRQVDPGERPDEVTRAGPFEVWRNGTGHLFLCGRVTLVAPDADRPPAPRPLTLHVTARPEEALPAGNYSVIVNWEVGCPSCGDVPRGSATGAFAVTRGG